MEDLLKLKGKNIVVMGVANERSLAWGVAKSLYKAEANLIYTYRMEQVFGKLTKLLEENHYSTENIYQCDVNDDGVFIEHSQTSVKSLELLMGLSIVLLLHMQKI